MIQCDKIQEKLLGFIDGDLRVTEQLCVEVHLSRCYRCREELQEVSEDAASLEHTLRHPFAENRFEDLTARIAAADAMPRFSARRRLLLWRPRLGRLAVATFLAVLAAAIGPALFGDFFRSFQDSVSAEPSRTPLNLLFSERSREIVKGMEGLHTEEVREAGRMIPPSLPEDNGTV